MGPACQVQVPLHRPGEQQKLVPACVWAWEGQAADEGAAAAAWLTSFLGMEARLLRYVGSPGGAGSPAADPTRRECDPTWAPPNTETTFTDGYPILLGNERSLEDLNVHLDAAVPMDRFRPNIVVTTSTPWEEDSWEEVAIGGQPFLNVKPCDRCRIGRINQETAEVGVAWAGSAAEQLGWAGWLAGDGGGWQGGGPMVVVLPPANV